MSVDPVLLAVTVRPATAAAAAAAAARRRVQRPRARGLNSESESPKRRRPRRPEIDPARIGGAPPLRARDSDSLIEVWLGH